MDIRTIRRLGGAFVVVAAVLLASGGPAFAHDPVFVTEEQTTPETGPELPDGTISFAVYGSVLFSDDTRGLEFDLRDGDDLFLQLLIPDLEPEISLADAELPYMRLTRPTGETTEIRPDMRVPFADPFSQTNYVTIYEAVEPAVAGGRYQVVVAADAATRFVVAVGQSEEFFTPTQRTGDKPTNFAEIAEPLGAWYSTPAGGDAGVPTDESGVIVDADMIEEALEELAADEAENPDVVGDLPTEEADVSAQSGVVEESPAEEPDESAVPVESEAAAEVVEAAALGDSNDSDDGGLGWVAPVLIIVAIGGGVVFALRRSRSA